MLQHHTSPSFVKLHKLLYEFQATRMALHVIQTYVYCFVIMIVNLMQLLIFYIMVFNLTQRYRTVVQLSALKLMLDY